MGRRIAGDIDYGVNLAKRAYTAVSPVLRELAPDQTNAFDTGAHNALTTYEQIREKVTGYDQQKDRVVANLNKKIPEINL